VFCASCEDVVFDPVNALDGIITDYEHVPLSSSNACIPEMMLFAPHHCLVYV
jgi:hypothetical protein